MVEARPGEERQAIAESPLIPGLLGGRMGGRVNLSFPGGQLEEKPFCSHFIVRSRDSPGLSRALERRTGAILPVQPNTTWSGENARLIWLSPSEWLLIIDPWLPAVNQHWLTGLPAHVIDVSSGQTVLRLSGWGARDLLSAGCMLDLHPRSFPVHGAAQSVIAKTAATIVLVSDLPCFEIIARRSYAPYLWRWLCQAARGLK